MDPWLIISAVFGLIYGSFLNVVILRFNEWRSIITGRSHCPECKTPLRWYDLIPVVSYATLRGRCRYCGKPIALQYPVVEIITAVVVAACYWLLFGTGASLTYVNGSEMVLLLGAIGVLMTIVFQDLDKMSIADSLSYTLIALSLVYALVRGDGWLHMVYAAGIGALPIAALVYPSRGKWMGSGDITLALGLGLLVGYPNALVFMTSAFLLGGLYGALALLGKKTKLNTAVPFAPFLAIGAAVALFWGAAIVHWYVAFILAGGA